MKLLEKIEKYGKSILTIISLLTILWGSFSFYNSFMVKIESLENDFKRVEQISMKNLIWNNELPLIERITACDEYISLGFNSFTKQYCEELLKKGE